MSLKPEVSLPIALATGAVVWGVYQHFMPNVADVQATPAHNNVLNNSRREATWVSAGVVGGISLITKDPTIFIVGGAMVIALDFAHRHANSTHHVTGAVVPAPSNSGAMGNPNANVS